MLRDVLDGDEYVRGQRVSVTGDAKRGDLQPTFLVASHDTVFALEVGDTRLQAFSQRLDVFQLAEALDVAVACHAFPVRAQIAELAVRGEGVIQPLALEVLVAVVYEVDGEQAAEQVGGGIDDARCLLTLKQ